MIRQAISCDICGAEKKQTNHWFVAYEQAGELRVSGWNSRNRLKADSKHLCGQACLHKLADDFMVRVIGEKSAARPQAETEEIEMEPQSALSPQPAPNMERRAAMSAQDRLHVRGSAAARPSESARPVARAITSPAAQSRPAAHDHDPVETTAGEIEFESSARLITAEPAKFETAIQSPGPRPPHRPAAGVLSMPDRVAASAIGADHDSLQAPLSADPPRYASHYWRAEAWERERERSLRANDHCSGDHRGDHCPEHGSEHATRRVSQA